MSSVNQIPRSLIIRTETRVPLSSKSLPYQQLTRIPPSNSRGYERDRSETLRNSFVQSSHFVRKMSKYQEKSEILRILVAPRALFNLWAPPVGLEKLTLPWRQSILVWPDLTWHQNGHWPEWPPDGPFSRAREANLPTQDLTSVIAIHTRQPPVRGGDTTPRVQQSNQPTRTNQPDHRCKHSHIHALSGCYPR